MKIVSATIGVALTVSALLTAPAAQAQYPDKPIKLIVPYAPGGTVDVFARVFAPRLEAKIGKPVVVENVAGAGGMIGVSRIAKATPDGYTIGLGIVSDVVIAPLAETAATYTYKDLEPIAPLGTSGLGVAANPALGVKSFSDLIAYAKKNPGKLSYGATGAGSLPALAMEDLKRRAGVDIALVPYASASKIAQDALGGHVDIVVAGLPALLEHLKAGKLSPVGVMSKDRDIGNPDMLSAGDTPELKGMDFYFWTGLFAPKGTPAPIVGKLNAAFQETIREPAIAARFKDMGVKIIGPMKPAEFGSFVATSNDAWGGVAKQSSRR